MKTKRTFMQRQENGKYKTYALVELEEGDTMGELRDRLIAIQNIIQLTIGSVQSGKKTVRVETLQKILKGLDHEWMEKQRKQ